MHLVVSRVTLVQIYCTLAPPSSSHPPKGGRLALNAVSPATARNTNYFQQNLEVWAYATVTGIFGTPLAKLRITHDSTH